MTTSSVPAGLRERKKARTRAAIREQAMRLFQEQGYAATTVEQIAAAADVSPSTFFRYFPAKEDVVITDDYDPMVVASMQRQPADLNPIETIRAAIHEVFNSLSDEDWQRERQRQRLFTDVPELRARAMQQYANTIVLLAAAVAERAGLPADDFSARVLAGAVIGAAMAGVPGGLMGSYDPRDLDGLDGALRLLRDGLPLGPVD
jgi:AcrR family transcriptional regulator